MLVNGNKWAGFTVSLVFHVYTVLAATRGKVKFMSLHSISNDIAAKQLRAKLTHCLTFLCEDLFMSRLSKGHWFFWGEWKGVE